MTPLVIMKDKGENSILQVSDALQNAGLRVLISFDSRHTRMDRNNILCPHHGPVVCNCRIVVMLVYESEGVPATLIAYGQDDEIWISLTFPPGPRPSARLQSEIKAALQTSLLPTDMEMTS